MAEDFPYRVEVTAQAGELQRRFSALAPDQNSGAIVTVAGRIMLRREMGKLTFMTLTDWTGSVQLFAGAQWTNRFTELNKLSLGDWVSATGEVVRTRTGELSVRVADWALLAEARRPFPDKWRGITDIDTRYRQRYADMWANERSREVLLARSRAVSAVRRFLEDKGFVEVETPVFHTVPGGATAKPFVTHHNALDMDLYLRIALELHLKRLVVGGLEKVFEIGRVFRNEGLSPRHNPEFTMLELYQAYADYHDMMDLTEQLVAHVAREVSGGEQVTYEDRTLDLSPPWRRATLLDLVSEYSGEELSLEMPIEELRRRATRLGADVEPSWGPARSCSRSTKRPPNRTSGARSSSRTTPKRYLRWPDPTGARPAWWSGSRLSSPAGSWPTLFPSSRIPWSSGPTSRPKSEHGLRATRKRCRWTRTFFVPSSTGYRRREDWASGSTEW